MTRLLPHTEWLKDSLDLRDALVFEDPFMIVLEKATGVLSQPGLGKGQYDSLVVRAQQQWPTARIVHRLDRDTSGLIVLALDAVTHRSLSQQFAERKVKKIYQALVAGVLESQRGILDAPIRKKNHRPPRYCVDTARGRDATTQWKVLHQYPRVARIELRPVTGRSHQLRVHMEYMGHPILGDPLYGTRASHKSFSRLALHATELALMHPHTGQWMRWSSPQPF